jgi:hypothetical protein
VLRGCATTPSSRKSTGVKQRHQAFGSTVFQSLATRTAGKGDNVIGSVSHLEL